MAKRRTQKRGDTPKGGKGFIPFEKWQRNKGRQFFIEKWRKQFNPVNKIQHNAVEAMLKVRLEFDNPNKHQLFVLCSKNKAGDLRRLVKGATQKDAKIIKEWYAKEILPELTNRAAEFFAERIKYPFLGYGGGLASLLESKNEAIVRRRISALSENSGFSKKFVSMIARELISELKKKGPEYARGIIGMRDLSPEAVKTLLTKKEQLIEALAS